MQNKRFADVLDAREKSSLLTWANFCNRKPRQFWSDSIIDIRETCGAFVVVAWKWFTPRVALLCPVGVGAYLWWKNNVDAQLACGPTRASWFAVRPRQSLLFTSHHHHHTYNISTPTDIDFTVCAKFGIHKWERRTHLNWFRLRAEAGPTQFQSSINIHQPQNQRSSVELIFPFSQQSKTKGNVGFWTEKPFVNCRKKSVT